MLRVFKKYYPIRNIFFVLGEGLLLFASVVMASFIILGSESIAFDRLLFLKVLLVTFVCQVCLYYNDLYDLKVTGTFSELGIRLLQALGFAAILLAFVYILFPRTIIASGTFIISICIVILLIVSWRFCYSVVLSRGYFNQNIILLGSSDLAKNIKQEISDRKDCGYAVVMDMPDTGRLDDADEPKNPDLLMGSKYEGLANVAADLGVSRIVAGFKEKRHYFPTKELLQCRVAGIDVIDATSFYEMLTGKLFVEEMDPGWLIFAEGFQKSRLRRFLKRVIDIILSVLLLVMLMPVIIVVAILIKLDSKGPVFFSQERVGENRKGYRIHKFRSMVADAEKRSGPVWAQADDDRITRMGNFMRKWRVDEIPQLWNVLKGGMSFVGPRPERDFFVNQLEERIPFFGVRFSVKPGITGWAQVCYGYGASVEDAIEKLNYDLFYIKNMSTLMDLMIVLRTTKIVIFGKGR